MHDLPCLWACVACYSLQCISTACKWCSKTCCSSCNVLLFASSMHSVVCLCLSACAIVPLNVLPVSGGKAKLLHAEYDAKVCVCVCVCVRRWRRLPSCSSRQGVCRVTSRPPSPVTSNMMRLTSHKMSLKRPKRYHHALPPFPHKRSSTTVQIGGPEMHAIACFLCLHVGSNAVEVMPCTYTVYSHVEQ